MALSYVAAQRPYAGAPKRGPVTRLLEDERWLAGLLLFPTALLLGLFIAYPFIKGVLLSVTDAKVGVPGTFVGAHNFAALAQDGIFREAAWNTVVYTTVTTVFKLALGLWLALLLNRHFRGKAITRAFILLPFIIPTVLSTFAWKWMFDPTFSVINWSLFRADYGTHQLVGRSAACHDLGDHRQRLARRAVLRHKPACWTADYQSRSA
jgi:multiple sugar transport system permease protein